MRRLKLLAFLCAALSLDTLALEITQTVGETIDANTSRAETYLALTLEEEHAFSCRVEPQTTIANGGAICDFVKIPALKPSAHENKFFKVEPIMGDRAFSLKITFKQNAFVYAVGENTRFTKPLAPLAEKLSSKRWVIVGYTKTPPIKEAAKIKGLNFPVGFAPTPPLSVMPLDLTGKPISGENSAQSQEFSRILATFKQGELADAQSAIDNALAATKGKHLFTAELLALKIKIIDKMGNQDDALIAVAKPWVEAYTTNKDLAEILLILGKAETRLGLISDGDYHYETLIREFPQTNFADYARIYRADRLLSEGHAEEARMAWERALNTSQDIPAASLAASRLAEQAIRSDRIDRAAELYTKIMKANPDFFAGDVDRARELMDTMADHKIYEPAALLAEAVLRGTDSLQPEYEETLLKLARWQNLAEMREKALETYNRFLAEKQFSKDYFVVEQERDLLEFELDNKKTAAETLELYDRIITKYPRDEASSRAIYKKAKLLLKVGRHRDVLTLLPALDKLDKTMFHDYDQQLRQTERVLLDSFVRQNDCDGALGIIKSRDPNLTIRSDEPIYDCASKARNFQLALKVAERNLAQVSPAQGVIWSEKRLDTLFYMADYPNYIEAEERYIRMKRALREPIAEEHYLRLFESYRKTGFDNDRMRYLAREFENRYPKDPRLMDIYAAMIALARSEKDYAAQYDYAKRLVNRARLTQTGAFTPQAEMDFAEAAIKEGKISEAILILRGLLDTPLSPVSDPVRARALFTLGDLHEAADRDRARSFYRECAAINSPSSWQKLCADKVNL
ncbi:MAG: hypothetical protein LBU73_00080 [Helicobacteraceae bacterium]|jgi:tetratricopeptide (TPR) repeat protein|nr:hypothetical protein [Helicobacteraceae bacterium]